MFGGKVDWATKPEQSHRLKMQLCTSLVEDCKHSKRKLHGSAKTHPATHCETSQWNRMTQRRRVQMIPVTARMTYFSLPAIVLTSNLHIPSGFYTSSHDLLKVKVCS